MKINEIVESATSFNKILGDSEGYPNLESIDPGN